MSFMDYSLLCAGIHQQTVGAPRGIRPLSPCEIVDRWSFSPHKIHSEASQLRADPVSQPAAVPECSKGLTFGSLFVGSRDAWLRSVLSILATTPAQSFRSAVQAADGPGVPDAQITALHPK